MSSDVKVSNVVATFTLYENETQANLNLRSLCLKIRHAEFNPKRFAAMTVRCRSKLTGTTTCLIFASGRCVVTGAENENASKSACEGYVRLVNECGFNLQQRGYKIQNIVASGAFDFTLNLCAIQKANSTVAHYDPSLFPGCIWKDPKLDGIRILLFRSGKIVLTGAKDWSSIVSTWEYTKKLVEPYKDTGTASSSEYRKQSLKRAKRDMLLLDEEVPDSLLHPKIHL